MTLVSLSPSKALTAAMFVIIGRKLRNIKCYSHCSEDVDISVSEEHTPAIFNDNMKTIAYVPPKCW